MDRKQGPPELPKTLAASVPANVLEQGTLTYGHCHKKLSQNTPKSAVLRPKQAR